MNKFTHVVGVGASAGGLDALKNFLNNVPKDLNAVFFVVQHLSPDYKSMMSEILQKHTELQIMKPDDGMNIETGKIYVLEPGKNITITQGKIHISIQDRDFRTAPYYPIDIFFKSLGLAYKSKSIGIILSGTGSDGSIGAKTIKENNGLIISQNPNEAQFDGMPKSVIGFSLADFICDTNKMGTVIEDVIKNSKKIEAERESGKDDFVEDIEKVIDELAERTEFDFSFYKRSTLNRRLERRMRILNMNDIKDYLRLLGSNSNEASELAHDFLINVTSFFRDKDAFAIVNKEKKFEYFNLRASELAELDPKEMRESNYDADFFKLTTLKGKVLKPEEYPVSRVFESAKKLTNEKYILSTKSGKEKKITVNCSPILSYDNKVKGVLVVFDILGVE